MTEILNNIETINAQSVSTAWAFNFTDSGQKREEALNCFYDLAVSPAKYDFISFLLDAEHYRCLTGLSSLRLIFVPGPNNGFRIDELPPQDTNRRLMMLKNILIPLCDMLGVPGEIVVCPDRETAAEFQEGEVFPTDYLVAQPAPHYGQHIAVRAYKRGLYPLRAVKPIDAQPDLITITLRESSYWPTRNGNRDTWLKAADMIKAAGLRVLFIPDVDSPPLEGYNCDMQASTDLHRRAALYESAAHNLFISNGPAWMAAAMSKPACTMFKVISQGAVSCSDKYFRQIGFPKGSQIGRDNHRIVWEDDTEEAVVPVVQEIINAYANRS